jgi:hypothetical protein
MWKRCPKCCRTLPVAEFRIRSKKRPQPSAYCRECDREYLRNYYRTHVVQYSRHRLKNRRLYRARNQRLVDEYLDLHPCVDCGEADPVVLEFDHVRGQKKGNVSELVGEGVPRSLLNAEIAKCDVRCANCHRRKTAMQRSYKAAATRAEKTHGVTGGSSAW